MYKAVEIEILAAAKALQFASELGISKAILEGDLEVIIKPFIEDVDSLTTHGSWFVDLRCKVLF